MKTRESVRARVQHDSLEADFIALRNSVQQHRLSDEKELEQMRATILSLEENGAIFAAHDTAASAQISAAVSSAVAFTARNGAISVAALYDEYSAKVESAKASTDAVLEHETGEAAKFLQSQFDSILIDLQAQYVLNMHRADSLQQNLTEILLKIEAAKSKGIALAPFHATAKENVLSSGDRAAEAELRRLKSTVRALWQTEDAAARFDREYENLVENRISFLLRAVHAVGYSDTVLDSFRGHLDRLRSREKEPVHFRPSEMRRSTLAGNFMSHYRSPYHVGRSKSLSRSSALLSPDDAATRSTSRVAMARSSVSPHTRAPGAPSSRLRQHDKRSIALINQESYESMGVPLTSPGFTVSSSIHHARLGKD